MKTKIFKAKLKDLKPTENNPRQISKDDFRKLKKSLQEFPEMEELREIVVDEDMRILGGHQRVKALLENGETEATVKQAIGLTDEQKAEFVIKDNVLSGEFDFGELANSWSEYPLDEWGAVADDWNEAAEEITEDEPVDVDESEPAKSELGGVYQLGRHRLMCGDSTDAGSVAILMDGQKADMVFTDPPYGMKKEAQGVLNDNLNYDKLLDFNKKWVPLTFDNLKENGSWYCWGIDEPLMDIYSNILKPLIEENKITFRNLLTWDKGSAQGQMSEDFRRYPTADEKCLFVMCGTMTTTSDICEGFENGLSTWFEGFEKFRSYFEEQSKKAGLMRSDVMKLTNTGAQHYTSKSQYAFPTKEHWDKLQAYCREKGVDAFAWDYSEMSEEYAEQRNSKEYAAILSKQAAKRKEWYDTRAYFNNTHDNQNSVWHFDRAGKDERKSTGGHATPKPLALCQRAIKSSSRNDESVLDVFGGSGSTLIACEQLGRTCYMMELDPKYCDVIRKRYWKLKTGSEEGWQKGTAAI